MSKNYLYYLILIFLHGCVEPYDFEVTETIEVLIVDGTLTDEQKTHQVKLSLSGALDADSNQPVTGASVWIIQGAGTQIDLLEVEGGVYETSPTYQGVVGQSYTLFVRLKDGSEYSSTTERMPVPVPIDSVYGRYMVTPSTEDDQILAGIQIFVDSHDETSDFSSFRFEYEEDYEIRVPYPSVFDWDPITETSFPRAIDVSTCYGHQESIELAIATTSGQSENRLSEFPVRLVGVDEAQLNSRYSIIIKQHAISSSTYQYYKNLKENNESSGSFFDKQKGTIPGNITKTSESGTAVLGYFEVSGVSTKTTFFSPDDYEDDGFIAISPFRFVCAYRDAADSIRADALNNGTMSGRNIFNFTFPIPDTAILVTERCSDCRFHGDIEKPDYWD
ncbi:MAG: DUF4249 domain-containing protein [Reichenbachiella sp.]|uniref:DUF4249 domain-containing protein n=1 Tax=Reichenbachiella sp. TaxID=2184521 RepID=UPI003264EE82